MSSERKVLLTGATGFVASIILPHFSERYDMTLLDSRTINSEGDVMEKIEVFDFTPTR